MRHTTLTNMKAGKKGKVIEISGGGGMHQKLMNMGIYMGREITKIGHLAMSGPVTIRVGRGVVAIGHSLAQHIRVEVE